MISSIFYQNQASKVRAPVKMWIVAIGKIKVAFWRSASQEYAKRLRHFADLQIIEVRDSVVSKKSPAEIQDEEARRLLAALPENAHIVALDASGTAPTSEQFAEFLQDKQRYHADGVAFCIGGPLGFAPAMLQRADTILSLSKMTLPHELARIVLLEQLYRGFSILQGSKYHKG